MLAAGMKRGGSNDQDGGIDEESEHQCHGGIEGGKFDRLRLAASILLIFAGLNDRGMQVKVMRHDGGAEDRNRDIKHILVANDFGGRNETLKNGAEFGTGKDDFSQKTASDRQDERDHQRFNVAKSFVLQIHHSQHIQRRDANAPDQWDFKEQVQGNRRTDYLREV